MVEEVLERVGDVCVLTDGLLATVGKRGVDRDAVQPGREGRVAAKGGGFAHHLQEDLLRDVLGVLLVAHHAPRRVVDARSIIVIDLLRRQVAALAVVRSERQGSGVKKGGLGYWE